jgi:F0F1-type ATP synthase assembly protein I
VNLRKVEVYRVSSNRPEGVAKNLVLAGMLSQVGCVTVVIVVGALLIGLGMDSLFSTRPVFTVVLLLLSIPVSLYSLVRVALSTAAQLQAEIKDEGRKEGGA